MKYASTVIAVSDIKTAASFYMELFGLEIYQNYGINISFTCGLSLQQEFDRLTGLSKKDITSRPNNMELCFEERNFDKFIEKLKKYPHIEYLSDVVEHSWGQRVIRFYDPDGHIIEVGEDMKMVVERFISSGMSMEEISVKMDASVSDIEKLMNKEAERI